jgi:hypothetical protein
VASRQENAGTVGHDRVIPLDFHVHTLISFDCRRRRWKDGVKLHLSYVSSISHLRILTIIIFTLYILGLAYVIIMIIMSTVNIPKFHYYAAHVVHNGGKVQTGIKWIWGTKCSDK